MHLYVTVSRRVFRGLKSDSISSESGDSWCTASKETASYRELLNSGEISIDVKPCESDDRSDVIKLILRSVRKLDTRRRVERLVPELVEGPAFRQAQEPALLRIT